MQSIEWIDLGGVNSYLIKNNNEFLLIDTGGHLFMDKEFNDRRAVLEKELLQRGVNDTNLKMILLTHGDNDHACNAQYFRERFHTKIAMNSKDSYMVENPSEDCYKINSNYQSILFRLVFRIMNTKIEALMKKVYQEFTTFKPDILLNDGDDLKQFGFDGTIYNMPGHTPGSICLLDSKGNLIAGDIFANIKKPSIAINANDFGILTTNAKKLLKLPIHTVYPGHGKPFQRDEIKI